MIFARLRARLGRDGGRASIPTMDGPLAPNTLLDTAEVVGGPLPGCDDLAVTPDGVVLVSSGPQVWFVTAAGNQAPRIFAEFEDDVSALHCAGARIYAGISDHGVALVEDGRETARLTSVDGERLGCVTAIGSLPDGKLLLAEGSARHPPSRWCHDLMERNACGRLLCARADLGGATTIARGLAWPYGLCVTADGREVWYTESWRHRIVALAAADLAATPRAVVTNLPGYPARISPAPGGDFWLALFAVRTHLVEHVLRETRYRRKMIRQVDPSLWIAPCLCTTGGYLEPLQMGAIKKLGIMKPWAPPRSYGLAVRLSASGAPLESLHSRVGGRHHGITAARVAGGRLLLAAKGADRLLVYPGTRHDA